MKKLGFLAERRARDRGACGNRPKLAHLPVRQQRSTARNS
jgi:hypothetical protein